MFNILWIVYFVDKQNWIYSNLSTIGLSIALYGLIVDIIRKPIPTLSPFWFRWIPLGLSLYFGWSIMANLLNASLLLEGIIGKGWIYGMVGVVIGLITLGWIYTMKPIEKRWTWTMYLSILWGIIGLTVTYVQNEK
jgi:hypothetical protein